MRFPTGRKLRLSTFLQIWASLLLSLLAAAEEAQKPVIQDLHISDTEEGARVDGQHSFKEGDRIYLDFRVGGFAVAGDPPRMKMEYDVVAVDDLGRALAPGLKGLVDEEITSNDKNWRPHLRYELEIPQVPRPGAHHFDIRLKDLVSGAENRSALPFRVSSKYPVAPASLAVYDLKFFRGETNETPLDEGQSFHRGDRMVIRFYVTGFRFSEKKGYQLEYGLQLKDQAGKTMFAAPKAAAESLESYYPKDFVPCAVTLQLDRNTRPGEYSITLNIRDSAGNQQLESVHAFRVE